MCPYYSIGSSDMSILLHWS